MSTISSQQSFSYDFYSGANVGIYIGDALITTVIGIEFSLVQNKRPIYGYASKLWDAVAEGTVQCAGTLFINFQFPQLLSTLIARSYGVRSTKFGAERDHIVNTLQELATRRSFTQDIGVRPLMNQDELEFLKQYYWEGDRMNQVQNLSGPSPVPTQISPYTPLERPDDTPKFSVLITYGDAFGNLTRQDLGNPVVSPSTVRHLLDVYITGLGQTITVKGEPILEQYPFICREVR